MVYSITYNTRELTKTISLPIIFLEALMKKNPADTHRIQETVKIGKTIFTVNHIFTPNRTKQEAWLSIITRAEGLKAK